MADSDLYDVTVKRRVPAWCSSLALHVVLMLFVPFLWFAPRDPTSVKHEREVGIVLTQNRPRQTEYLQKPTETDASSLPSARSVLPRTRPEELTELSLPSNAMPAVAVPLPGMLPSESSSGGQRIPTDLDPSAILAEEAQRRAREAAAGPATELSLFGAAPAEGRSFVFLIDRSKSMGKQGLDALEAAERELQRSLQELRPQHRFQVMAYHHECIYLGSPKLLPATKENLDKMNGHLSGLAAFGATEHEQAILAALYLKPDVIFVLTDGGDPELTAGERQRIRRVASGRTSIHCLHFGWGPRQESRNFLERLAAENGGGYGYVDMSRLESIADSP